MTKRSTQSMLFVTVQNLGWPVFIGLTMCVAFYALLHAGLIDHPMLRRYFAGHPVEYVEAAMFFVGLAALIVRLTGIGGQFATQPMVQLPPTSESGDQASDATRLLETLRELPRHVRKSYLAERLRNALQHVARKESAENLDEELKYLADLDAARQHEGYALVRIIIWATPMLGFLGTVIGITLALGDLSPEALVNSPEQAMQGLLAGLSVAFDTTALALSLSIVLMFGQFLTNQLESDLLSAVDTKTSAELVGRFEQYGTKSDPQLVSVRRMAESVLQSTDELVQRQIQLWQEAIHVEQERWSSAIEMARDQIRAGLGDALTHAAKAHATELRQGEQLIRHQTEESWRQLLQALLQNASVLQSQQAELAKQGDLLMQVVSATGDITRLEGALNNNLRALAGAKNFEETVMSLSAAIHLLNARVNDSGTGGHVELGSHPSGERAA